MTSRNEIQVSHSYAVMRDPHDRGGFLVKFLKVEGLAAVRNRDAWVKVSRHALAQILEAGYWPDDLKDAAARLRSYLSSPEAARPPARKLPLVGRDRVLIRKLAELVWGNLPNGTMTTPLRDMADRRGFSFDVQVLGDDGKPTGHVARVRVELDRYEEPEKEG